MAAPARGHGVLSCARGCVHAGATCLQGSTHMVRVKATLLLLLLLLLWPTRSNSIVNSVVGVAAAFVLLALALALEVEALADAMLKLVVDFEHDHIKRSHLTQEPSSPPVHHHSSSLTHLCHSCP